MKHLLKLASGDGKGYFEEVDQYTFNNSKFALADDGVSPRYEDGDFVIVDDDGSITVHLACAQPQDLAVLVRGLNLPSAPVVGGKGCVRETPPFIKFQKGRVTSMLETKTGTVYSMNNKRAAPKEAA
jgi:hypothetical protein